MIKNLSGFLFLVLILMTSCSDDDPSKDDPANGSSNPLLIRGVWVHDVANNENASDLRVVFDLSAGHSSSEIKIVISKKSPGTPITNSYLESIESSLYTSVIIGSDISYIVQLDQEQLDSDGDKLTHNVAYLIHIYVPKSKTFFSNEESLVFSNNLIYQSRYIGEWGDNLFAPINISGELEAKDNGMYNGPVYLSVDFLPAFGAKEDNGSFDMTIVDGEITAYKYTQHAPEYRGGCPGTYTGSGSVDDNFSLIINFIGDDCDGHHEDGVMILHRVWKE